MTQIDLNCDMGESFGAWRMGADADVMPWVSSVNIACGFHAGDPVTMHRTMAAAAAAGVTVGAHIGLPDRVGFGRRELAISAAELHAMSVVQIGSLAAIATSLGQRLAHVKPHGALYHMLEADADLAAALVQAIAEVDASLRVVGMAGGRLCQTARDAGLVASAEGFADRRYADAGHLLSRREPGAVLEDIPAALGQAVDLALRHRIIDRHGQMQAIHADTICVHGDRPDAAVCAKALRQGLEAAGVQVRALPRS